MRRKKSDYEEKDSQDGEEVVEELSEKEQKKLKQKESVEKRKNAKRKDKVARWGGVILLGLMMFVGFLLWVFGEMKTESQTDLYVDKPLHQDLISTPKSGTGTIIVK